MKPETRTKLLSHILGGEWATTQMVAERAGRSEPWAYDLMNELVNEGVLLKKKEGRRMMYARPGPQTDEPEQVEADPEKLPGDLPPLIYEVAKNTEGLRAFDAIFHHLRSLTWTHEESEYFRALERHTHLILEKRMRVRNWRSATTALVALGLVAAE